MSEESSVELSSIAQKQRDRMPDIVSQVESIVQTADPIELLSHLTMLYQTHPEGASKDSDDGVRWQAKSEWLAWLIFSRRMSAPDRPATIDGQFLGRLEPLLEEYFQAAAFSLMVRDPNLDPERDELRARIQAEALFVRGLGYPDEMERFATELYSPHDSWCVANLGLNVRDAFAVAWNLAEMLSDRSVALRARARELEAEFEADFSAAVLRYAEEFPVRIREALESGEIDRSGPRLAKNLSAIWLFFKAPYSVSVADEELRVRCRGRVGPAQVSAFLSLLSTPADAINGEPSAIALNPLAFTPFVQFRGRCYLFVPARLFESLFFAFHSRLFADKNYRAVYDDARAEWLESSSVEALRGLLPRSECGRGLFYGPKKARLELDGLLLYDNKVILIECKSKSPTLAALAGDVPAILNDLSKAILEPFDQAKRARDFIRSAESVEFEEEATGHKIRVRAADISEMYLLTLVGSGAWAPIAANLPSLAPLGLFRDGTYPWALPLADLRVVAESLELPSQLFDYLRRRYAIQKDGRFYLHDEWDFLGVYLAGDLYPENPSFAQVPSTHSITLDGFDEELQAYYFAKSHRHPSVPERPRRKIPRRLLDLLRDVERAPIRGRSDAIAEVLGWPDGGLSALEEKLARVRRKALWDGRPHAVTVQAADRSLGVALAYAYEDRVALGRWLEHAIEVGAKESGIEKWIGFGCNLGTPDSPIVRRLGR
jgi:hypothetical protein